jgi:hypothetical protein
MKFDEEYLYLKDASGPIYSVTAMRKMGKHNESNANQNKCYRV